MDGACLRPMSSTLLRRRGCAAFVSHVRCQSGTNSDVDYCYNRLDKTFRNTVDTYKSKSNYELLRGLFVLRLCSVPFLARRNLEILRWLRKIGGQTLFRLVMRASFFGHFVAGETQDEVKVAVGRLRDFGVKSILDYSVEQDISSDEAVERAMHNASVAAHRQYSAHEQFADRREGVVSARTYFYEGEPECDRNAEIFCSCIDAVAETTGNTGLLAVKLTALGRPKLLMQLSDVIAQSQQFYRTLTGSTWENVVQAGLSEADFLQALRKFGIQTDSAAVQEWFAQTDFNADGIVDIFEWGRLLDQNFKLTKLFKVLNLKTGRLEPLMANLSELEELQCENMMRRLSMVVERAVDKGVRVMIDAEQTYFQPAISRLTLELMRKYNVGRAVVFNTYQAYLTAASVNLELDMHLARTEGFYFAAKLVRGAYMEQERARAVTVGYDDPINETYEATSRNYERLLERILDEAAARTTGAASVMCATHNEQSVRHAVELMRARRIAPNERVVCFGQLYGMCDQVGAPSRRSPQPPPSLPVSFALGMAGYSVYKYMPYGPMDEVLPYLARRATENSDVLKGSTERKLMGTELRRRLTAGDWWHRVAPTAHAASPVNLS